MITEQEYQEAREQQEKAQETINQYFRERHEAFNEKFR